MRKGLAISLAFHAAILIWAVAAFPSARDLDSLDKQPIPVEVVTPSEISQVKAGKRQAKKEKPAARKPDKPAERRKAAKKETKRPKRVSAPAPKPAAKAPAEPAPKPLAKKAEPKPEKKPEKIAKKAPPPMPSRRPAKAPKNTRPLRPERKVAAKPARKEKAFDPDQISALLNKQPDASAAAPPSPARKPKAVAKGAARGRDAQMTLSEIDALRQRISQCWNPPVGGLGAEAIRVKLRLQLNQDGMLSQRPQVVNREGSPFFQAAADSAVRAVMLCQPYALPGAKYALWRDMILNFDPREMYGG